MDNVRYSSDFLEQAIGAGNLYFCNLRKLTDVLAKVYEEFEERLRRFRKTVVKDCIT